MGKPILCEQLSGGQLIRKLPCSASLQFADKFGHFVTTDSSGDMVLAATNAVAIVGWAFSNDTAKSSTAGADWVSVNVADDAVYRIPACNNGSAVTEANLIAALGKCIGVYTSGTSQYGDLATAGENTLLVVGYDYYGSSLGEQYVHVKRIWAAMGTPTEV